MLASLHHLTLKKFQVDESEMILEKTACTTLFSPSCHCIAKDELDLCLFRTYLAIIFRIQSSETINFNYRLIPILLYHCGTNHGGNH